MAYDNLYEARGEVSVYLSDHARGYHNGQKAGHFLFPRVFVNEAGGKVLQWGTEAYQEYSLERAPGGERQQIGFGYYGQDYALTTHDFEIPLPKQTIRDARRGPGIDLGQQATAFAMRVLTHQIEIKQARLATDASRYASGHTIALAGPAKFSDPSVNIPKVWKTWKEIVRQKIGVAPNVAIGGPLAYDATVENPSIISAYQYKDNQKVSVTSQMLAARLEMDYVGKGEGIIFNADGSRQNIWGNSWVLAYVPPMAIAAYMQGRHPTDTEMSYMEPSFGSTYTMTGHPMVEEPYYNRSRTSWMYPGEYECAPVLTSIERSGPDAGKIIAGFLAMTVG